MSSVEDILWLDNKTIQEFARGNLDILAAALAFQDDEVKQKVFRSVTAEEWEKIEQEISEIERPSLENREKLVNAFHSWLKQNGYEFENEM